MLFVLGLISPVRQTSIAVLVFILTACTSHAEQVSDCTEQNLGELHFPEIALEKDLWISLGSDPITISGCYAEKVKEFVTAIKISNGFRPPYAIGRVYFDAKYSGGDEESCNSKELLSISSSQDPRKPDFSYELHSPEIQNCQVSFSRREGSVSVTIKGPFEKQQEVFNCQVFGISSGYGFPFIIRHERLIDRTSFSSPMEIEELFSIASKIAQLRRYLSKESLQGEKPICK